MILSVIDFIFLVDSEPFKNKALLAVGIMMEYFQWMADLKNITETECMHSLLIWGCWLNREIFVYDYFVMVLCLFEGWWSNLVFVVLDWLMVILVCYTSTWSWLISPTEGRYEEYHQKLLFVLVMSVDLRFGQLVLSGWYSDRIICSQNGKLWINWKRSF